MCYLCRETGHMSWNCPQKAQWDQYRAERDQATKNPDHHVSNVEIELLEDPEDQVNVASMTRAQRRKVGLPPIEDQSKVPEPRKTGRRKNDSGTLC